MNAKFFDLPKEKQDRMINAALKVFALNGYRHATTDDIVREAGISKGLLFHYFGNKLGVYTFVFDYSVRFLVLELKSTVDSKETDFFELTKQIERARMHAMRAYPYMQMFLNRTETEDVSEALLATEGMVSALSDCYDVIYKQMDMQRLPGNVPAKRLSKMLELTVNGLMVERFQNASFQPEMLFDEIEEYVDMLKGLVG